MFHLVHRRNYQEQSRLEHPSLSEFELNQEPIMFIHLTCERPRLVDKHGP